MNKNIPRRVIIKGLAGVGGALAAYSTSAQTAGMAATQSGAAAMQDPSKIPGGPPTAIGQRATEVGLHRETFADVASVTPLQDLHGTLTPADLHFERHHAGVPAISAQHHELLIHGMVDKSLKFSLQDLQRYPASTRLCFIECSGNLFTFGGERTSPQMLCGLTSQSEWTGVPLRSLLNEAGLQPKASWLLAEGGDAALMTRSITVAKALDDAMVVYAQNGEPLRPEQGYPIRLLLPGWEGNTNVKWLRRLELSDQPFMTREETAKYTDPLKNGTARQFSVVMDARSIITSPSYPARIEHGWHEIRGLAWSGRGRIVRVDVSTDGGKHWQVADLHGPVLPKAHTRFTLSWRWTGGGAELLSRAVDETGYVQPSLQQLVAVRGQASTPYHMNPIVGWLVQGDGQVLFKAEM